MGAIKNVLLVVNPISGAMDKTDLIEDIKKEVIKKQATLFVFETSGREDVFNLKERIKELNPSRLIVAGGDGTIKLAAEALKDQDIPLGIIPAGSANGLAFNLKLPATLPEQITAAFGDSFNYLDIILLDGDYCLHMSDFGVNAELIRRYEKSSIRGKWGYFLQTVPTLLNSDYPFKFTVEANDKVFEAEGILLAIANASSYGTGAKVNPKGKLDDGFFEILIYKEFDFIEILKTLRNVVDLDPAVVEVISTKRAKITCHTPVPFQIDGEYLGKRKSIEAEIIPQKLRIAVL
ncbi:diacylglycerol kinase [Antarcticibacterium flavum]|uniref:Diacylglycerol kinase n=1 Tax=Antarcticibacterium flavum TaxID=2058175 RepID=A0A5B7X6V3_9FLAO|nr:MULTISPECIES: diacylglycerol kinase family protein [Antarcticibacterium]MCM4160632.1 diacylglycerol kinase [Antarcticibacterium sp. W02-3]QCY71216.1 diacylglycerol kinase [Antarcticibacterium flavum]